MRILIIGGTGVLSRAIALAAADEGHQVTILTDGLGALQEPPGIERHLKVDRRNGHALATAISETGVEEWDLVVDAICYNEQQAHSLLAAIKDKSRHTVVISTAIIYDRRNASPINVDSPLAPSSELGSYGMGKVLMERVWLEAARDNNTPITIFRLPHILGTGCELGVIPLHNRDPLLLHRIAERKPLLLADRGTQQLQVVFNDDVARIVLAACGKSITFGRVYNCANPEIITGRMYFEELAQLLKTPLEVKNVPSEAIWSSNWGWASTTVSRILNLDSLQRDVGLVPRTPLSKALEVSLSYLEDRLTPVSMDYGAYLDEIDKALDGGPEAIKRALSSAANTRLKTPVDVRMNSDAPTFIN